MIWSQESRNVQVAVENSRARPYCTKVRQKLVRLLGFRHVVAVTYDFAMAARLRFQPQMSKPVVATQRRSAMENKPAAQNIQDTFLNTARKQRASSKGLTAGAQAARDVSIAQKKVPSEPQFSAEESLGELRDLAISAGAEIAGELLQRRDRPDPATLIGRGKLEEIAGAAASVSADLLLFDHDLTASQQRNIEKVVNARV